jgi:hypothetical protein
MRALALGDGPFRVGHAKKEHMMKTAVAAIAGLTCLIGVEANAAAFCNCCGEATAVSCKAVCEPVKPVLGQCVATIDFEARTKIAPDQNPLYDISLDNFWLNTSDETKTELFRRLLERSRRGVEADRRLAAKSFRAGRMDRLTIEARTQRYEDALVNYYLGAQAYKTARHGRK